MQFTSGLVAITHYIKMLEVVSSSSGIMFMCVKFINMLDRIFTVFINTRIIMLKKSLSKKLLMLHLNI